MTKKEDWVRDLKETMSRYFDGDNKGFDSYMNIKLADWDYEEQSMTLEIPTQEWQINEREFIHGGIIASMMDTGLGTFAAYLSPGDKVVTTDLNITYIRGLELGDTGLVKSYSIKVGRTLIRVRGDLISKNTGELLASATGTWMPAKN